MAQEFPIHPREWDRLQQPGATVRPFVRRAGVRLLLALALGMGLAGVAQSTDRLYVGRMTLVEFAKLSSLPLPSLPNQKFCSVIRLAPDMLAWAYVPTPAERVGDFSGFSGTLLDPLTNAPFPNNVIPVSRLPDPFAWRIAAGGPVPGEPCLLAPASLPQFSTSYYVTELDTATDTLLITPSPVSTNYQIGDPAPLGQDVTIRSQGQPLDFLIGTPSDPGTWLTLTLLGHCCRTPLVLQVGFHPLGLRPGFYFSTVSISPIGAIGTPFALGIGLFVTAPPQWITVDKPVLRFTARLGDPTPPPDKIVNVNAPAERVYDVLLRVVSPAGIVWARVSSTSGVGPGPLRISILAEALPSLGPGSYLAVIDIIAREQRFTSAGRRHTDATTCGGAVDQERIAAILEVSPEIGLTASLPQPAQGWAFVNGAAQVSFRAGDVLPDNSEVSFDRNTGTHPSTPTGQYDVRTEVRNPTSLNWLAATPTSISIPYSVSVSLDTLGLSQLVPCQYDGYLAISSMGNGLVVPIGLTVTEANANCSFGVVPPTQPAPASGTQSKFWITATCRWSARSTVAWIHVDPSSSGVGNGVVTYTVDANTGPGRTGYIIVGDKRFEIVQAAGPATKPAISQVANAWNGQALISDSAWIFIKGTNLAPRERSWDENTEIVNGNLPKSLDGVSVKIGNNDAFVSYISEYQINVQVPSDGETGQVPVVVKTGDGNSDPFIVTKQTIGPALFNWPASHPQITEPAVGALFPDSDFAGKPWVGKPGLLNVYGLPTRPAAPKDMVLLFVTGCGNTNPPVPAGRVVDLSQGVPTLSSPVNVTIGGIPAEVAGNTGFLIFAGECQFNVTIPDNAPDGDLPVVLDIGGISTAQTQPDLYISVQK